MNVRFRIDIGFRLNAEEFRIDMRFRINVVIRIDVGFNNKINIVF